MTYKIDKDAKGEYRWQVKAANGKIIGASTEGYKNKADCIENMKQLGKALTSIDYSKA